MLKLRERLKKALHFTRKRIILRPYREGVMYDF
nr:MAG TPA: hypothetical protein [Caudoviricetes sp.]